MEVVDPVCGKQFEQGLARRCEMVLGRMHYFCSNACHRRFDVNRDRYVEKSRTAGGLAPKPEPRL